MNLQLNDFQVTFRNSQNQFCRNPRPPDSPARHQQANTSQPKTTKPVAYRPHHPPQLAIRSCCLCVGAVAEALRKILPPSAEHLFPNEGAALIAARL
jgi:hypothetical protein